MKVLRLRADQVTAAAISGRVLTHDLGRGLRKGTVLGPGHVEALRAVQEVHLVELDEGDVHEDAAARRLGAAVAGPGTHVEEPVQSQIRVVADRRGLVRVERGVVDRLNHLPAVGVFTLVDGQAVEAGEEVAGAKVTPVAVPGFLLREAELVAHAARPVLRVDPFRPLRTLVVVTERLKPRARELFAQAVTRKLGWYGAELLAVREVARDGEAVLAAYHEARELGSELVLFAGASSIDPLDPAYAELEVAGGELLRQGAPAHPGSMLWLGRLGETAVLGVASCAGFGKNTSLDLVLPFVFAYGRADELDLARLGYGGLIEEGAGRRFPPYPPDPPAGG
jgi:molybdenum cofactor cytidylyltransferase